MSQNNKPQMPVVRSIKTISWIFTVNLQQWSVYDFYKGNIIANFGRIFDPVISILGTLVNRPRNIHIWRIILSPIYTHYLNHHLYQNSYTYHHTKSSKVFLLIYRNFIPLFSQQQIKFTSSCYYVHIYLYVNFINIAFVWVSIILNKTDIILLNKKAYWLVLSISLNTGKIKYIYTYCHTIILNLRHIILFIFFK